MSDPKEVARTRRRLREAEGIIRSLLRHVYAPSGTSAITDAGHVKSNAQRFLRDTRRKSVADTKASAE